MGPLERIGNQEPICVLFSGGIDSGSVLMVLYHLLLSRGEAPTRLKAFTLSIDGCGSAVQQALAFLRSTNLEMLLEVIEVDVDSIDYRDAIRNIEDYKPLDVQWRQWCMLFAEGYVSGIRVGSSWLTRMAEMRILKITQSKRIQN